MPISKKKRPKKRNKSTKPEQNGEGTAHIHFGGIAIPEDLIESFRKDGLVFYYSGREDRARGAEALTYAEFVKSTDPMPAMYMSIVEAQYAQYMDGYTGADYRDRVIFRKDYLL